MQDDYEDVSMENVDDIFTALFIYVHENAQAEGCKQVLRNLGDLLMTLECGCQSDRVQ